jgi:hypothetical protein
VKVKELEPPLLTEKEELKQLESKIYTLCKEDLQMNEDGLYVELFWINQNKNLTLPENWFFPCFLSVKKNNVGQKSFDLLEGIPQKKEALE